MPNPDHLPVTPERVQEFAERNDAFGFEMRVCEVITRSMAAEMTHGGTYSDPVTRLARQYDFRFKIREERRCLSVALECKGVDPHYPVIICGRRRPKREAFHHVIVSQTMAFGPRSQTNLVRCAPRYREDGFVGKSILKPERDEKTGWKARARDEEIHDKWAQAIASSHALIVEAAFKGNTTFSVVLPVVVVPDGALWSVGYDETGTIARKPEIADHCAFFVNHGFELPEPDRHAAVTLSHIHFVTLSGLRSFLNTLAPRIIDWEEWIPDELFNSFKP